MKPPDKRAAMALDILRKIATVEEGWLDWDNTRVCIDLSVDLTEPELALFRSLVEETA